MANDSIINTQGKNISLYRTYTENNDLSTTLRLAPAQFRVGVGNSTPLITKTKLDFEIPIEDGTANDDGNNTLTGSSGGDNTTDNTTTFKQGAGQSDVTSQNLIANNTNVTKIWTISDLSSLGTNITQTLPFAIWFYINDAADLAKFKTSGTCIEVKLGSDSSNYFSKTWTVADVAVGWNWLTSVATAVEDLTETGTVSGSVDTFIIEVTTNNATDTFVAGDVLYDLLRTWAVSDLNNDFSATYPTFDFTNNEVTYRCYLSSIKANGFLIDSLGIYNKDTIPLMAAEDTFEDESKSNTDEFSFIVKDRIL